MSEIPKSSDAAQVTPLKTTSPGIGGRSTGGCDAKSASMCLSSTQRLPISTTGQVKHCQAMNTIRTEMAIKAQIFDFMASILIWPDQSRQGLDLAVMGVGAVGITNLGRSRSWA